MKRDLFKQISLRVIIFLLAAVVLSVAGVLVLKYRTEMLEEELAEEMEGDRVIPGQVQTPDLPSTEDSSTITTEYETGAESEQTAEVTSETFSETEETAEVTESISESEEDTESEIVTKTEAEIESDTENGETDEETAENTAEDTVEDDTSEKVSSEKSTEEKTTESKTTTVGSVPVTTEKETTKAVQTTATPTTVAKTTAAPTTVAPTTTTQAPTPAPTTPAPTTTVAPTTAAPVANPVPIAVGESLQYITAAQLQLFKNRILQDINALRSSLGLGALAFNDCLTSGSIVRSTEIVSLWSHTRPNGDRGIYIVENCGGWYKEAITALRTGVPYNCAFGENLAVVYGASDFTGTDQEIIDLADEMFINWKNSPTHYENLVYAGFHYIGVGVTVNMDDVFHAFWTCTLFSN